MYCFALAYLLYHRACFACFLHHTEKYQPPYNDRLFHTHRLVDKRKGLVRQHLGSYNYFISHDIKNIVFANQIVDSNIDSQFYLKYTDVRVSKPSTEENMMTHNI